MTREEYARHFTNVSNRVLVELVDDPADSDPVAVHAATQELLKRDLSGTELTSLRAERTAKEEDKRKLEEKVDRAKGKVQVALSKVGSTIMADSAHTLSESRALRIMMIVIGIMLVAVSPRILELRWIAEMRIGVSTAEHFLPLVVLPLTLVLLWKNHRAAWFLGAVVTVWSFTQTLVSAYLNWGLQPSDIYALDSLFPIPSEGEIIGGVLFATGLVAAFQLRRSLLVFRITERERWLTIGSVVVLAVWMWSR